MNNLYVGVDIGKSSHVAAILSKELLTRHKKYEQCPSLKFEQSRTGFELLLKELIKHAPASQCHVLLEKTGHYGSALEQFLQEHGCTVYRIQAKERATGNKTDQIDARRLSVLLYTQIGLGAPVVDAVDEVRPLIPASDVARTLRGLVKHRHELIHDTTMRKNKLTSILDELFPEFTQVYMDPNTPSALALREKFPVPSVVASAQIDALCATRLRTIPSRAQLETLQQLATTTIGTKDQSRLDSLQYEQAQIIIELRLLQTHIEKLEIVIGKLIADSREGQILTSIDGIGTVQAATLIAGIGSIANFESPAKLRGYIGWAPKQSQTGTSMDSAVLNKSGNALLKQTMFMVVMSAVRVEPWKSHYTRLVEKKCAYDGRTKRHKGKLKVVGRIAGQMIGVIWTLLKNDHDTMHTLEPSATPPAPLLYDRDKHGILRH